MRTSKMDGLGDGLGPDGALTSLRALGLKKIPFVLG